jgi:hypothetical protein
MSKAKQDEVHAEELGKVFSRPAVQVVLALDSLTYAVACQPGVNASVLARHLKQEARNLKPEHELAKAILQTMIRSASHVALKRGKRRGASSKAR